MPSTLYGLKYLIDNECFVTCPLLAAEQFVSYCKDRGIATSIEQLEQFERLGIFHPVARIQYPKIKLKIEYIDDGRRYRELGILRDGEEWTGDVKETHSSFRFNKDFATSWLEEGLLWEPSSRPFRSWDTFKDENWQKQIESFYSIFQCYPLNNLVRAAKLEIRAEWWVTSDDAAKNRQIDWLNQTSQLITDRLRRGVRGMPIAAICQIIANRYYPETQSDRRTINLTKTMDYYDWDWFEYCRAWSAEATRGQLGVTLDQLKDMHQLITLDAQSADPIADWYELICFVSLEQKKRLKGKALLAQALYSMENMIRLFYRELTKTDLPLPSERVGWKRDHFYGEGVTKNELQYLEFVTNQFHLNPKPQLILVVEGDGEAEQFPRVAKELFGLPFPRLGIEVMNIQGVGNFTGRRSDKYGALEKFIDYHHLRQTIVFIILDREGGVARIKRQLIQLRSKFYPKRKITREDYIHVWDKSIEFDNFSDEEIARAMTDLSGGANTFDASDIAECRNRSTKGNPLMSLFERKCHWQPPKPDLLKKPFDLIISAPEKEFDDKGEPTRLIAQVMRSIVELATLNHQPVTVEYWERNQESGYLGEVTKE